MKLLNEVDKYCKENKLTEYEISLIKEKLTIKYKGFEFNNIYELDMFVEFLNNIGWDK